MKFSLLLIMAMLSASTVFADTELYLISPQDGDTVIGEGKVRGGLAGMGIAPAGVDAANTGHHQDETVSKVAEHAAGAGFRQRERVELV